MHWLAAEESNPYCTGVNRVHVSFCQQPKCRGENLYRGVILAPAGIIGSTVRVYTRHIAVTKMGHLAGFEPAFNGLEDRCLCGLV